MKVGIIQMAVQRGCMEHNWNTVRERVAALMAAHPQTNVVVLPELWSSGYDLTQAAELSSPMGEKEALFLGELARQYRVSFVGGSVLSQQHGVIYNRAQVITEEGVYAAGYNKIHLFRLIDEHLWLGSGTETLRFSLHGMECGAVLCYDIRFCELPRSLALAGAQTLFVSAQWPLARKDHWVTLLKARAIENQMYVVACNTCGDDAGMAMGGHSCVIAPDGTLLAAAGTEACTLTAALDVAEVDRVREKIPVFSDRSPRAYTCLA